MTLGLLDQFRPGIIESLVLCLHGRGSITQKELISIATANSDGPNEIRRYFELLTQLGYLQRQRGRDELKFDGGPILQSCRDPGSLPYAFRLDLMHRIATAADPNIRFFRPLLVDLLDKRTVTREELDRSLRTARATVGIGSESGDTLKQKIDFCEHLLKYFRILYPIPKEGVIVFPRELLLGAISRIFEERNEEHLSLFSELFPTIDAEFFPVLHRQEQRLLSSVGQAFANLPNNSSFILEQIPDGGRVIMINQRPYNQIRLGGGHAD